MKIINPESELMKTWGSLKKQVADLKSQVYCRMLWVPKVQGRLNDE